VAEYLGIDGVSFGEFPGRLGEVAHLARVDRDDWESSTAEVSQHQQLQAPCRLEPDQGWTEGL
jgi:hypothetical protein